METAVLLESPAVAEDGILINPSVLPKFEFKTFEARKVDFGASQFPLNLYKGD